MKKLMIIFAIIAALFLVAGCAEPESSPAAEPITAPSMGVSSSVVDSGSASTPASAIVAETEFDIALTAISNALPAVDTEGVDTSIQVSARMTEPFSEPYYYSETNLTSSGTVSGSSSFNDEYLTAMKGGAFVANKTYINAMAGTVDARITTLLTGYTFTDATGTYVVTGKIIDNSVTSYAMDVTTGATSMDAGSTLLDYAYQIGYGAALMIKNTTTGVGAKYIISFTDSDSITDMKIKTDMDPGLAVASSLLGSKNATLSVYNDSDEPLYTISIPMNDVGGLIDEDK